MNQITIAHHRAHAFRPLRAVAAAFQAVSAQVGAWRVRQRERAALLSLSNAELQDIGISRAQANFDYSRPFWRG